jgi:gamma-glutamylcyclotransferase (GGCT)/AIG2-like uncharacterized protein YtfP
MMITVFVYGTLKQGENNHFVIEPYVQAIAKGTLKGELLHLGPYPALFIDGLQTDVHGEWVVMSKDALAPMDQLEGFISVDHPDNDYERIWVSAIDNHGQLQEGWTYIYKDRKDYPVIPDGIWRNSLSK